MNSHLRADLRERAVALRLRGLVSRWAEISEDPDLLTMVERVVAWEEHATTEHRQRRLLSGTRIKALEPVSGFDWNFPKSIRKADIIDLFSFAFLADKTNVVFLGPSGVGKTTLAQNLVHEAARAGHEARFVEAADMLDELLAEQSRTGVEKALKRYAKPRLLAIDEVGYLSYDNRHADLLLRVIQLRHRTASTVITTNRPFAEWREMFPNASSVVALVDRLTENCEVMQIEGDSYRKKISTEKRLRRGAAKTSI
jgi:DNA replication protein DnaC